MDKYIIEVPGSERDFFLQLLKRLPKIKFKKVENAEIPPEKQEILDDLRQAFLELKEYQEGKREFKTAEQFLSEIKAKSNYE
jgi:hypothetical protein